jgi:tRNA (Thr-GGU) A37 N-methylase
MPARPERIRIGVFTFETRKRPQNLVARHVGQVQVEKDDVVVVELAEIDAFFPRSVV